MIADLVRDNEDLRRERDVLREKLGLCRGRGEDLQEDLQEGVQTSARER